MRILLLGGTGAMGVHLTSVLSDRGDKVVVTSRIQRESKGSVKYFKGNAKDINFLRKILQERCDAIVDFMVYSEDEFKERVDLFLNSTFQYIFLSSARVYDDSREPLIESSPRLLDSSLDTEFLATNEYSLSKARQEDLLHLSNYKNWTIIRPYITYGEERLQLGTLEKENWLYRALNGRSIVFLDDMKEHLTTLTYSLDVASGIAKLIGNQKSFGEIYNITSGQASKWSEIITVYLDILEEKLGYSPNVIYQDLSDFLDWNPGKYQIMYDRLFDRKFDNTKINKVVDTKEFIHVKDGLSKSLDKFLSNPKFKHINWKNEAIKDRYAKEKTSLKEIMGLKQKIKYLMFRYIIKGKI